VAVLDCLALSLALPCLEVVVGEAVFTMGTEQQALVEMEGAEMEATQQGQLLDLQTQVAEEVDLMEQMQRNTLDYREDLVLLY
jgi:hypothetical protein